MKTKEEVVQEMQQVVEQMRLDDIEENPDCENEFFTCDACGGTKSLAGSVQYGHYRLCNDCVLYAEVGFELGQIKTILHTNLQVVIPTEYQITFPTTLTILEYKVNEISNKPFYIKEHNEKYNLKETKQILIKLSS